MKMEEWKECKLGDLVTVKGGKRLPKGINLISTKNSHPYIRIRDLGKSKYLQLNSDYEYVDNETQKSISRYITNKGDVLISIVGTIGLIGIVGDSLDNANLTENCVKLIDLKNIDSNYLYYFLSSEIGQNEIKKGTVGAVQPKLPIKNIQDIDIPIPLLPTQQKIAVILSSLDDKIELNNKITTNLEQQAQAIFKNWFVDFEPFGGKMPEGWKLGKLSEYCNFQEGYVNPAQTHNEYFDGDVKWLRAVDINESFILNTSRTLTKCGFESAGKSAFLFKPGSIAISKSGTVGRLGIISDFMCGNRAVIGIELKEQQNLSYIHQYLKSRQTEFPDMAVGSVQKNLYVSILENLDIIIPSKEVLEKFAAICIPFYDQIKTNCIENNNLCSIRDTLLPKLMNGEIEV